ncbi:MAG TPA: lipoate protein ligase C-terminal domain-containing protein [Candidatus Saccharimonadales bacterium]|nr:lipoate protein ligase C-terminal domain-containing protein [Candidatus Saccharimonadales bacterium]
MHGVSKYKVPGGKLIEVRIDYEGSITKAEILGDFFLYPEESIADIEKSLVGVGIGEDEAAISERISKAARTRKAEMVGITSEAIAKAVKMAVK